MAAAVARPPQLILCLPCMLQAHQERRCHSWRWQRHSGALHAHCLLCCALSFRMPVGPTLFSLSSLEARACRPDHSYCSPLQMESASSGSLKRQGSPVRTTVGSLASWLMAYTMMQVGCGHGSVASVAASLTRGPECCAVVTLFVTLSAADQCCAISRCCSGPEDPEFGSAAVC